MPNVILLIVGAIQTDGWAQGCCANKTGGCNEIPDLDRQHTTDADANRMW